MSPVLGAVTSVIDLFGRFGFENGPQIPPLGWERNLRNGDWRRRNRASER
jgi:hypothetical protein